MKKTAIIIPVRLGAKRFPNKPLAEINGLPMVVHVLNRAKESRVGKVFVATPDIEILNIVKKKRNVLVGDSSFERKEHFLMRINPYLTYLISSPTRLCLKGF